jgi:proline iminopeptidase
MKLKKSLIPILALIFQLTQSFAQDKNYEEWYLTTKDSVAIFVKEIKSQSKDTVIVIHGGFGANQDYMLDAIKGLEKKFHFILYDQRGSLLSPAPFEKLTFQKNVNDLFELITELKVKKAKLLCHSMGTQVGMEFAKQHPELISNLVPTGTLIPNAKSSKDVFSNQVNNNIDFLASRPEVKKLKKYYLDNKANLSDKEKTEYWRISFAESNIYDMSKWKLLKGGQIYYNQEASVMDETVNWNFDYRSILDSLKTTIIQGQYDFLDFNLLNFKEQIKEFKNIDLKIIPNAGHNAWIDKPKSFKKYLKRALK